MLFLFTRRPAQVRLHQCIQVTVHDGIYIAYFEAGTVILDQ
jgi:hypothetical protein